MKKGSITRVKFEHCIFFNCYFRGVEFDNVSFTGCKFIACNFKTVRVSNCTLDYSEWSHCHIDFDQVMANLPRFANVRRELLIHMRTNAKLVGNDEDAKRYIFEIESCTREHLLERVWSRTRYYREKRLPLLERVTSLRDYIINIVECAVWGYGEKPSRVAISGLVAIISFALYYFFSGDPLQEEHHALSIVEELRGAVFFSATTFACNTPGMFSSGLMNFPITSTAEALLGVIFIGVIAAALHRSISK